MVAGALSVWMSARDSREHHLEMVMSRLVIIGAVLLAMVSTAATRANRQPRISVVHTRGSTSVASS
jgi:hypothetical protein